MQLPRPHETSLEAAQQKLLRDFLGVVRVLEQRLQYFWIAGA